MRIQIKALISMAALAVASFAAPANAAVDNYLFGYSPFGTQQLILNGGAYTINATTTGWVDNSGYHIFNNPNYIVGDCSNCSQTFGQNNMRDYFSFDLSNVTGPITSAVLSIGNGSSGYTGAASTFVVHEVTSFLNDITTEAGGLALYNGIGAGTVAGSKGVSTADNNTQVTVNLNAFELALLNSLEGGTIALGGTLGVSSVPLPAGLPMFGTALLGLFGYRAKRKVAA